jgi:hypothetical protein
MATKTFTQFRVDNVVTTLPTTLQYGQEVYYKDASGNLTLWVGHEDGTAWPAVGYKEYVAIIGTLTSSTNSVTIIKSDFENIQWVTEAFLSTTNSFTFQPNRALGIAGGLGAGTVFGSREIVINTLSQNLVQIGLIDQSEGDYLESSLSISLRIYP